jgi:hypothetical protein
MRTIIIHMIYDFLYLDNELLRSLLSQFNKGLTEQTSKQKGHTAGTQTGAKGKIFGLAEFGGEGRYEFSSSDSETKSLHHHAFALLHEHIQKHKLIDEFESKPFVLMQGSIRFIDGQKIAEIIKDLPSMIKGMKAATKVAGEPQDFSELNSIKENAQDLASLMLSLTGGNLLVRIGDEYIFLDRNYVHSAYAPEIKSNGKEFSGNYKLIGIPSSESTNKTSDSNDPITGLVDALNGIEEAFINVSHVKPLAIYKEILS